MADLYKYGVAVHLYKPMIKRAVVDFAVGADWTPAAGDVKISKDGGAAANVTNLPTVIVMGNGAVWDYSITATEMQAAKVRITIVDSATKAVEDNAFEIDTYGNASAQHLVDLTVAAMGALMPATAGRTLVVDAAGLADANMVKAGPTGAGIAVLPRYTGTARAGGATTVTNLAASTPSLNCEPGDVIIITGGTGVGESNTVNTTAGMGGATPVATMVQVWPVALDATSTYEIVKTGGLVPATATAVWDNTVNPTRRLTDATGITSTGGTVPLDGSGNVTANVASMNASAVTAAAVDSGAVTKITAGLSTLQTTDLNVNIIAVNGTTVNGSGTTGSPWGP